MSLISDLMSDSVRATGLSALMKGAGLATRFIPIPQPTLLVGPGSAVRLAEAIAGFGHGKLLIVTDAILSKLGILKGITAALDAARLPYALFDEITPDAPIPLIERAMAFFWMSAARQWSRMPCSSAGKDGAAETSSKSAESRVMSSGLVG